jgi:thioredoxin 1
MGVLSLGDDSFRPTVESTAILVVEFAVGAAGDEPCHPLADRFPQVSFARVDLARAPAVAGMFGLGEEPALLVFRDRIVLYFETGAHGVERLTSLLTQVCALDMVRVREAIEEEKRAEVALRMRRVCPTARRGPLGRS